jgi:hypothetical protein
MSESCECTFHITWHGQMDFTFLVVPIECDAQVTSSVPVFFDFVVLLKCLDEVVDVCFVNVFNAKVCLTVTNDCCNE